LRRVQGDGPVEYGSFTIPSGGVRIILMRFEMYRRPKGAFDGELVVALLGLFLVAGVVVYRLVPERYHPERPCTFHVLTGLPCLTCGGTRAAKSLGHFRFVEAIGYNPLVALWLILAVPHALWVAASRKWKLARPRLRAVTRGDKIAMGVLILLVILGNWAYLVWAGV